MQNDSKITYTARLSLLCGSPRRVPGHPIIVPLTTTARSKDVVAVDPGDLVLRITIAGEERAIAQDGAGIRYLREMTFSQNGRVFHATLGQVEQVSTTTMIDGGFSGEWIGALARGCGSMVKATTDAVRSALDTVHRMSLNVFQWREDDYETYREEREQAHREDWFAEDDDGNPFDQDEALSCLDRKRDDRLRQQLHEEDELKLDALSDRQAAVARGLTDEKSPNQIAEELSKGVWGIYNTSRHCERTNTSTRFEQSIDPASSNVA